MSGTSGRIDTIGYVILFVKDVAKAAAWYHHALGVGVHNTSPEWAELETQGTVLALHRSDVAPPFHHDAIPAIVFNVEDVRGTYASMKERSVKLHELKSVWESPEVVGVSAEFHDLDGNRLSLHGVVPRGEWKG
jgi:predicted enzyme related to lactoylglutathione lyase